MARILITGGSGFIGTNLVQYCQNQGHEVLSIDVEPVRDPAQSSILRVCDIMDKDKLVGLFKDFRPEIVHHLAARTDIDGKNLSDYDVNINGVRNVLDASRAAGVRRIVVASSQLVNPLTYVPKDDFDVHPPNAYGASKVETEKIVRGEGHGLEWVLTRATTIWGPWFGVKYQGLYRTVKNGRYMHPKGLRIQKVWGYVGNAAYSLDKLAQAQVGQVEGKTFYLADEKPYDLLEYAELIRGAWSAPPIKQVPYAVLQGVALVGDALMAVGKSFPLHSYRLGNFMAQMKVSTAPLISVAGPSPVALKDAVGETVEWMKAHPDFNRDASLH